MSIHSAPSTTTTTVQVPDSTPKAKKTLPVRQFHIPRSSDPSDILTIQITEPALRADNLVLETWASSSILAAELRNLPITFPATADFPPPSSSPASTASTIPVLELGAGTGLVGLAASLVYAQPVVLTDLPPIVPGLQANIAINAALLSPSTPVSAGVLDWTAPSTLTVHTPDDAQPATAAQTYDVRESKAHVILAADTLYSEEHPELLSRTVGTWLARDPEARFVMGTALRVAYLDELRELWGKLEEVGLECVREGKGMASEVDFDDERLVEWSFWRWRREVLQAKEGR